MGRAHLLQCSLSLGEGPPLVSCRGGHLPEWADPLCHGLCSPAFHYESNSEADKQEFEKALETIAVSFSST